MEHILSQWQQPSDRGGEGDRVITLKEQLELMNRSNTNQGTVDSKLIEDLKKEVKNLKRKQESHVKYLQKLKSQIKFKDGLIREEQGKLNQIIRDLK
jgi:hypothetical protein